MRKYRRAIGRIRSEVAGFYRTKIFTSYEIQVGISVGSFHQPDVRILIIKLSAILFIEGHRNNGVPLASSYTTSAIFSFSLRVTDNANSSRRCAKRKLSEPAGCTDINHETDPSYFSRGETRHLDQEDNGLPRSRCARNRLSSCSLLWLANGPLST